MGQVGEIDYFARIKNIWAPWSLKQEVVKEHIIPFCTPILENPEVILMGLNHARFDDKGDEAWLHEDDKVGALFASAKPKQNTYSVHDHQFAKSLRETLKRTTGLIFDHRDSRTKTLFSTWMGTNRCPVQCHKRGESEVKSRIANDTLFRECQRKTDEILREMIRNLRPKYVLLAGVFAVDLFRTEFESESESVGFEHSDDREFLLNAIPRRKKPLDELKPSKFESSILVPLKHFSYAPHLKGNASKLEFVSDGLGWKSLW